MSLLLGSRLVTSPPLLHYLINLLLLVYVALTAEAKNPGLSRRTIVDMDIEFLGMIAL